MADNDYYQRKPLPNPSPSPGSSPYYSAYAPSTSSHTQPPSYSSQQHLVAPGSSSKAGSSGGAGSNVSPVPAVSPFESVFDDHVYPMNSQQSLGRDPNGRMGSSQYDNQYGQQYNQRPQQDAGFYGMNNGGASPSDDIPLRDRLGQKDADLPDHVYDSTNAAGGAGEPGLQRQKSKKGKIRFGELGMLGSGKKAIPWVCYIFSIAQIGVFIGEIAKNAIMTGSPIMIHPQFNPMIGPSTYVLVNMGSRYVACMHNVEGVQDSNVTIRWPCPNTTTAATECTLSELCGFGGVPEPSYSFNGPGKPSTANQPNQWFRFIVPIFLHAGLIHIGFNLLLQLTIGREMEQSIGSLRFFLVYVSAGIFGFVMGGNYAATGISSTGASGSLFGIIALTLIDLLYSWKDRRNPVKDLMFIMLDIIISFVLGLLPGLDNFSHIGGFLMGLALGICLLHSPNSLRRRIGDEPPYTTVGSGQAMSDTPPSFFRNPVGFFKGRKPLWWAWWLVRVGALVLVTVVFILLLQNFYVYQNTCGWCKYLSCLPINDWCDMGNLIQKNVTKRDLLHGFSHPLF